jgi:uncharacterized protein (TIRG00374 family)
LKTHFLRRHVGKLAASAVITACLLYAIQSGGLKIWPQGVSFARIRWWGVFLYFVTLTGMNYFRAVRWRFLLRSVVDIPKGRLLAVSWIGFAAIFFLPFRIGEFVRPYMIRAPEHTRDGKTVREVSMSMATGSVVAERITDALYLSIVLALALILVPTIQPLPRSVVGLKVSVEQVRIAGFTMLGVFTAAFFVLAVFYFARAWAHRTTLAIVGTISLPLAEKLARVVEHLADGLHFLGRPRDAFPFLAETTAYWGLNVLGIWFLALASGIVHADGSSATLGEACSLMGTLGVTILIPGPPGLLGVFQAGLYAGMTMYYPTDIVTGPGAAYVFVMYAETVVWSLIAAGVCLLSDRGALKALEEAEVSLEQATPPLEAPGSDASSLGR